jgi:DnaJ-domain-containing protein 1
MARLLARVRHLLASRLAALVEQHTEVSWEPLFEAAGPDDSEARRERARPGTGASQPDRRLRALEILELAPNAGPEEIHSAYRRLCKRYHPDRFSQDEEKARAANELLVEINRAYEILGA